MVLGGYKAFRGASFGDRACGQGLFSEKMSHDEACLTVTALQKANIYTQYSECHQCPLQLKFAVSPTSNYSTLLDTTSTLIYEARTADHTPLCRCELNLKEYGIYELTVPKFADDPDCCRLKIIEQPTEYLLPLLFAIITILCVSTFWYLLKVAYKKFTTTRVWEALVGRQNNGAELLGRPPSIATQMANTRLRSMDVFRGMTIASMILVNYGGGGYWFLKHAVWNGLTFADLVFPHFAFLMGVSLFLSLHTRLRAATTRQAAFWQILRRSAVLILLGLILSSKNASISNLRIYGVLQRLGLSYFFMATLECFTINFANSYTSGASLFRDLKASWFQWLVTAGFVAVHLVLTFTVVPPDCPAGYLGPGGLDLNNTVPLCTGGAAGYIDRYLLGSQHLYNGGTFKNIYQTKQSFDPEGFVGMLTCCLVVQFGIQAGRILLSYNHAKARIRRWLAWSLITGLAAGGLCLFSKNDGPIPINKNLWSLSYCLITSSIAFFILAVLYISVDMYRLWGGRPFYYAGRNSLLLYIGSELMRNRFPFSLRIENPSHAQLLSMDLFATVMWLVIAIFLHHKKIILTI